MKTKATNIDELKTYLSQNPIIIQYRLAIPIIHKVHIGNKNEANTEVAKPNDVFTLPTLYTEQTHIDLTNNGIIPKVQSRDYIAYLYNFIDFLPCSINAHKQGRPMQELTQT